MSNFNISFKNVDNHLELTISGKIGEEASFENFPLNGYKHIDLYLGNVKSMNSYGIHIWIKWISTVGLTKVYLHECPRVMIEQLNMIDTLWPKNSEMKSFYIPYYNEELNKVKNILVKADPASGFQDFQFVDEIKDAEGNTYVIDVVPVKYFRFIKYRKIVAE